MPGLRPWLAFLLRQPSLPVVFCLRWPLPTTFPCLEKMELQRTRRRRDELGHQPLCDVARRRVGSEADARARRLEPPPGGARIAPQHPRRLRARPLEDVAPDEHAQVRAAHRMAA